MLLKTAVGIIVHEKEKFAGAVGGVALAIFLMLLQAGFYLGYKRDITAVLDAVDADIWVVPKNQPMFDNLVWTAMDDLPYWKVMAHPDMMHTSRLVWGYTPFRIPGTGGKETAQVLGVEFDSGIQLKLDVPPDLASLLRPNGHVLLGYKDRRKLGVSQPGVDGVEILGRKATPVGFIPDIHLFTTAGFVLTDLDNARAFLRLPDSYSTYVVGKCRPGADVAKVAREIQQLVPEHDILTSKDFHTKAAYYWETATGIGPVLLLSSLLAVLVGFLMVMQALYVSTIEKIPVFACLKALGASNGEIVAIVVYQVVIVFVLGCLLAAGVLWVSLALLAKTTISVVITRELVAIGMGVTALCSAASSFLSIRKLVNTDPGEAFRT
jgi:putative ABC transport system permease protein